MKALLTIIVALALTAPALASGDPLYVTVKGEAHYADGSPYAYSTFWLSCQPDKQTLWSTRVSTNRRGHFRTKVMRCDYDITTVVPQFHYPLGGLAVIGHVSAWDNVRHLDVVVPYEH